MIKLCFSATVVLVCIFEIMLWKIKIKNNNNNPNIFASIYLDKMLSSFRDALLKLSKTTSRKNCSYLIALHCISSTSPPFFLIIEKSAQTCIKAIFVNWKHLFKKKTQSIIKRIKEKERKFIFSSDILEQP